MNIQQLRYLVCLAENETLTAAARLMGVSQPSISRALRDLEAELRTPILKRSGRKLSFTNSGKEILAAAQRAIAAFNDVTQAAAAAHEDAVLRIGICHSTFVQIMPALQLLTANFRKLHVRMVHAAGLDEMLRLLRDSAVDMCFGMAARPGSGIIFTPHEDLEIVLLSPRGTKLPSGVTFADLSNLPLIGLLPGRERAQMIDNPCMEAGFHPRYVLECNDPSTFLEAVRAGIGSILVWRSVGDGVQDVEMRRFNPPRMLPIGFYHNRKPGTHVRALLALSRPKRQSESATNTRLRIV